MVAAIADIYAVLILHILDHAVDFLRHVRVKVDTGYSAVGTGFEGYAPAVGTDHFQILNRAVFGVREEYADTAPVTVVRFVGVEGVCAV